MSKYHVVCDRVIKLNVGGSFYSSTKSTLTKTKPSVQSNFYCTFHVHGSHLWRIFTGDEACPRDERGSYFLDRDGPVFRHILNYLRSDRLTVPAGFREFDLLKVEADYYGLDGLVQEVDAVLQSRKRNRRRPPRKKTSQSVQELHRVHERNGNLYISDEESDWFYD